MREASSSTVLPVTPAGTITQTARGLASFATSSSIEAAPRTPRPAIFFTAAGFTS